jgi:hypothetical protein
LSELSDSARERSLQSYIAMKKSKEEHLEVLIALDKKRKSGQKISLAEEARLATLLEQHSKNVQSFAEKMAHLKDLHPGQEKVLLKEIEHSSH